MKNNGKKTSIFSSIRSMFSSLFSFGPDQRQESLEQMVEDDVIISPSQQVIMNFKENKLGVTGLISFILIFVIVFGSTSFSNYSPYNHETVLNNLPPGRKNLKVDKGIEGKNIENISSGVSYSVALDDQGEIYFWGQNPGKRAQVDQIIEKTKNANITAIASGDKHIVAVTDKNEIIGAGESSFGQTEIPTVLKHDLVGDPIVKIAGGVQFTSIVTESGNVHAWGSVLPNNLDTVPESIQGRVVDMAVGPFNIIVLLDDGTLSSFGQNGTEISNIPEHLKDGSHTIEKIVVSNTSALALDSQGKIHGWGSSSAGMLNLPEIEGEVLDVAATRNAFLAVSADGKAHAWGGNRYKVTELPKTLSEKNIDKVFGDYFQFYAVDDQNTITAWGNEGFRLGTDNLGRDILERLMHGGRVSLTVGAIAMIISTIIGVIIGLVAGFYGGVVDNFLMRLAEVVSAFPFLPLAITLSAFLPVDTSQNERLAMIMVILGVISWPGVARLVRGQILAEREKDFVLAARALGLKERTIIIKHILPSVFNFIIVSMTLGYASSLLTEAGLSFLGFGVVAPAPSWGNMLNGATNTTVIEYYWWQWFLPAILIMLTALSVNLIGDALRDAMDPRSNQR